MIPTIILLKKGILYGSAVINDVLKKWKISFKNVVFLETKGGELQMF